MKAILVLRTALLIFAFVGVTACEQEQDGPAERAGERIDQAVEQTKDQVSDTVEKAGEKIEEAGDTIRDKTDQ
jgi:hyperosmotically inducible protein